MFESPNLDSKTVCISDDYVYSCQISSCFNEPNTYFCVIEPPRTLHKYWRNEFTMLNNLLAKIRPKTIIFSKIDKKIQELIKKQLNLDSKRYEYINNDFQLETFMKKYESHFKGMISCPPDRKKITHALLEAKKRRYRLIVDKQSDYKIHQNHTSKYIVVSDSISDLLPPILSNYAFSINSDLFVFDYDINYSPKEILDIFIDSRSRGRDGLQAKKIATSTKSELKSKLDIINKYEFTTFLTGEFLYGTLYPEKPTTHIYNKILPSHFIASAISRPNIRVSSALLVDTNFFEDSEVPYIHNMLEKQKVQIKELFNNNFTNLDLDNAIQFYPYDLLHICSHAGLSTGTLFEIEFIDKAECKHIITLNTYDSFDPTDKGYGNDRIIEVKTFFEFVELDNQPWYAKTYKKGSSRTVVEDFLAIDRKDWKVISQKKNVPMKYCNLIMTKDRFGNYLPMIQSASDPISSPLVFNNACMSTYTLASNFIYAGASFYVGTINFVNDAFAVNTAKYFYDFSIKNNESLAISLWKAQNKASVFSEYKVFASIGCHFQKIEFDLKINSEEVLKQRLAYDIFMRQKRLSTSMDKLEKSTIDKHQDALAYTISEFERI